jgi:hypothetical protein
LGVEEKDWLRYAYRCKRLHFLRRCPAGNAIRKDGKFPVGRESVQRTGDPSESSLLDSGENVGQILIHEMCVSKYIYCELDAMTGEWKIQIILDTSKFARLITVEKTREGLSDNLHQQKT